MKILITGGFGYLGGRVAQFLASGGRDGVVLGSRHHAESPRWLPGARVVRTQWTSTERLEEICTGIDVVVHLAGMNAQDCAADPAAALALNAVATARLLRAAVKNGTKRFIYLSTAHVYGSPLSGVITEAVCPVSLHPYATSHRAGEDVVRAAHQEGQIEGVVIRLSNAYGAPAHKNVNCWMLLVNDLCRQAVTTKRMVLRSSGLQRRDFIAMNDVCRALEHLLKLPSEKLGNGLFNVGGNSASTVWEMTQRVAGRVHALSGFFPKILRGKDDGGSGSELKEYSIRKMIDSGFAHGGDAPVDREIDALVRFCQENEGQPS